MIRLLPLPLPAQLFEPSMPSVTATPFVERWVTGSGFAGAGVLVGLGIVAYLVLSRGSRARLAVPVAAGLWLLGGAAVGVGQWVVTPREQLRAAARELVSAAVAADRDAVAARLHADARVRTQYARAEGRDRILPLVDMVRGEITGHSVRRVEVDLRGPRVARTHLRLSVTADRLPPASIWTIDWQRGSDEAPWQATLIEPYWIQGMTDPAGP
jgi:hypothetical protein